MRLRTNLIILIFLFSLFAQASTVAQIQPAVQPAQPDSIQLEQTNSLNFHGLAYGPFRGVGPDETEIVTRSMIEEDMAILQQMNVTDIRTYGIGLGLNQIPFISDLYGIKTATGTWIHPGNPDNYAEIDTALAAESVSSMIIVGNEVLTGGVGFNQTQLIDFINHAKTERKNQTVPIPIATAENYQFFAAGNFTERNALGEAVDTLIIHVHPAWQGDVAVEDAAQWTIERYNLIKDLYPDKDVILGETGWPSSSTPANDRFTPENQKIFYQDLLPLLAANNIKAYLFDAFDENWKHEFYEGTYDFGSSWGIIEEKRYGKPAAGFVANYFGGSISTTPPPPIDPVIVGVNDFQVDVGADASIEWTITDEDTPSGSYVVYRNNVLQGAQGQFSSWSSGTAISWPVDTSVAGKFTYKIVVSDDRTNVTFEDSVVVTVGDTKGGFLNGFGLTLVIPSFLLLATVTRKYSKRRE